MKNKNKTATILLVIAVFVIWAIVIFKIYNTFFDSNDKGALVSTKALKGELRLDSTFQFDLNGNYRDPFLGGVASVKSSYYSESTMNASNSVETGRRRLKTTPKLQAVIDLSFILFKGLIKNQKSNMHVALVEVNGSEFMAKEGEIIDEVHFVKYYKDSVKVLYKGQSSFIKKSREN